MRIDIDQILFVLVVIMATVFVVVATLHAAGVMK